VNATVKDVMTNRVVSAKKTATYKDLALHMRQYRISAFPVVDESLKVIGVVSESDLLPKEAFGGDPDSAGLITGILRHKDMEKATAVTAYDLMTSPAVTVSPDDSVQHAARLMYDRKVKRLPVVDQAGLLVGIVSRTDILAVFDRPDDEIRREVVNQVILSEFIQDPRQYTVQVKDGIVTLAGAPDTSRQGRDMITRVRHVQGVVAVRDRLSYPADDISMAAGPLFMPRG